MAVTVISDTAMLTDYCRRWQKEAYVTVDTEFIREKTYFPLLCLIQVAGGEDAAVIDPLAPGISLAPLLELMRNKAVLKVFHAGSQDLEIFYQLMDGLPDPIYDTQIAAMVCGFGEQVGYEAIVQQLCGRQLDKSQRFTDWSLRPLRPEQLQYALADVTHLQEVYRKLESQITKQGRQSWIYEELSALADPEKYVTHPDEAWLRLRPRERKPHYLARLKALAQWREEEAIRQNKPRGWILNDDAVQEIAQTNPLSENALKRGRAIKKHLGQLDLKLLVLLIEGANTLPTNQCPRLPERKQSVSDQESTRDLLKVLLKLTCQKNNVAPRLVASAEDINDFLLGVPVAFTKGWRMEVFGQAAEALLAGKCALAVDAENKEIRILTTN